MKRKADWLTVVLWLCVVVILMLAGNVIGKTRMIVRMTPIQMEGTSPYVKMDVCAKGAGIHASGAAACRVREAVGDCE